MKKFGLIVALALLVFNSLHAGGPQVDSTPTRPTSGYLFRMTVDANEELGMLSEIWLPRTDLRA